MQTIYEFDSDSQEAATGALLVYAVWRSRDVARFKITPEVWSQVERFTKASAKRARTTGEFLESLKPRLLCGAIRPDTMFAEIIPSGDADLRHPPRQFLTAVMAAVDEQAVLHLLYRETAWIILLVRDRLERERPIESKFSREDLTA